MALLETQGLTVRYGGVHANDDVDLTVEEGSFVGLIGPNGAGKTTFIDAITGFVTVGDGTVHFDGSDITHVPPHRRSELGLARTFQQLELFEDLTVMDNLLVAAERPRWTDFWLDMVRPGRHSPGAEAAEFALAAVGLEFAADRRPDELSHGQRKLAGVARALAAEPRLILLDEPAAGLDTAESEALGRRLRALLDHGSTVLLVDHDMGLVLNVCDRVFVLDFGAVIAEGTPEEIRDDPRVIAAYLGEDAGRLQEAGAEMVRNRSEGAS